MKIKVSTNYHTRWGESLYICGSVAQLGMNNPEDAIEMTLVGPGRWEYDIELKSKAGEVTFFFIVKEHGKEWRFEWGQPHNVEWTPDMTSIRYFAGWHAVPDDKPFYSSAFVDGMLRRNFKDQKLVLKNGYIQLRVEAPLVGPDEVLAICGEGKELGNWNPADSLIMNDAEFPVWRGNIKYSASVFPLEYKFVILDKNTHEVKCWEAGNNRICDLGTIKKDECAIIDGLRMHKSRGDWKGAGTAIPVFSIRTNNDFGVGDFRGIHQMVDWCVKTGQKVLQILPINDTTMTGTWVDSYPYKANSTFALHPMYLNIWSVGTLKDSEKMNYYRTRASELNELADVDYEAVNNGKISYLRELFAEQGGATVKSKDFKSFLDANIYWLKPYAAWCVLREMYNTPDNNLWGDYAKYDENLVDKLIKDNKNEIDFYYFLQYHLDRQLRAARDYAHSHGVVLKGDIPIGISRFSADAWVNPELFNMNTQAGAPPDDFSIMGQNWGFPTYNWEEMAKDGFQWWKNRFQKMAEYFDAYRIDHILGFFRIWEIPMNATHGLLGYFNPALPFSPEELRNNYDFWINVDLQTNPLILEWMLGDFFGEFTEEVKERFLDRIGGDRYFLKEFINTQAKVEAYFDAQEKSEKNNRIRESLLGIIDDVLFIEDPYTKGHYHPRIAAQYTYQYRILSDYAKSCFDRLYVDFFYRRHNDFWYGKAMWKLPPLLDATTMLTCAEDLGMIPDCVPEVMRRLQILSLEIQRMPKDPNARFGDTWHYPYYSVCTTSTHDMAGVRGWWESDPSESQKFYNEVLHEPGNAPFFAEPWICDKIVDLHLKSPSMLCILPLQDWLACDADLRRQNPNDEQINVPANPKHYWKYRMHISVEDLMAQNSFNSSMLRRINDSGR